jgi:SAM-dependent methyltransferase
MTPDFNSLSFTLTRRDPGIWFSGRSVGVSYPAFGNAACLAVEERSFWFRHRNRCIVSLVRRYPPDGCFLDIGGGNGFVSKGLTAAGFACAVLEPGIDGALAAHARGIDPVICARLEDAALPAASFAAAGMFDVLEHIEDEVATLKEVHRLLASNGHLFLTVPAYPFLFSVDDVAAGHHRRYTISILSRVLNRAGFRVKFASYVFAPLPPIIFLLRTAPSKFGLRRGHDPERDAAEHTPGGIAAWITDLMLSAELKRIQAGRSLPFGGSCICVAEKVGKL